MNKEQIISAENGNINDSNNINEGNAGRDIITHNYTSDINGQETYSDLLDIIKNQRIVTERLQHQIDRMQDQMEEYQSQFTKVQEIKEKLMDMLLEDREMLKLKIFGKLTDN